MELKCNHCWANVPDDVVLCSCRHLLCLSCVHAHLRPDALQCPVCATPLARSDVLRLDVRRNDTLIPYGSTPTNALECARKAIELWTFQMGEQNARRRAMLSRERAEREHAEQRASTETEQQRSEMQATRARVTQLEQQLHATESDRDSAREQLSSLQHGKRKLGELYAALKERYMRDTGGALPDTPMSEEADEEPTTPRQQQSPQHHLRTAHNIDQHMTPVASRLIASPLSRSSVASPFARAGIASPKKRPVPALDASLPTATFTLAAGRLHEPASAPSPSPVSALTRLSMGQAPSGPHSALLAGVRPSSLMEKVDKNASHNNGRLVFPKRPETPQRPLGLGGARTQATQFLL